MNRLYLNAFSVVSPLGDTLQDNLRQSLAGSQDGLQKIKDIVPGQEFYFGKVADACLAPVPQGYPDTRCNRLLLKCLNNLRKELAALKTRYSAERIAVILGSANTSIDEAQSGINKFLASGKYTGQFSLDMLEIGSPSGFVSAVLGSRGPAYTISTACTSSAKVFSAASRLFELGVCDAAVVGGVDELSRYASSGFCALEALSAGRCNPLSVNRDGINIGEAAALIILERQKNGAAPFLAGLGETSDAHHATAPRADGKYALAAMTTALQESGVELKDIGFIALHGTGTKLNDAMEARAVYALAKDQTPCLSFKSMIGHTLGAAGSVELVLGALALAARQLPPHIWDGQRDAELEPIQLASGGGLNANYMLSNAFAFGGSNSSIIIGRE
ncbi:MAG: beta-ketoacyl-[acyl-carrier-protein] synthase II [Candidatus Margulisbacteria bacterium]|jgi:3-oxoacyl-[acyl-carrier-protein] synthase-1|nr:beta-ketoacyl-[acyl-carrier-protein] synthase II [Candidatus Margulisiibacteriota bacterium]